MDPTDVIETGHDSADRMAALKLAEELIAGDESAPAPPNPPPEQAAPEAPTESTQAQPEPDQPSSPADPDADLLEKIRAEREKRQRREHEERRTRDLESRLSQLETREKALAEREAALLRDPLSVVKTREDYERLTQRILSDGKPDPTEMLTPVQQEIRALKEELQAERQARIQSEQAGKFEQAKRAFVSHTADATKYPALSKLEPDERVEWGLRIARENPDLDDALIAKYADAQLRKLLKHFSQQPTESTGQTTESQTPDPRPAGRRPGTTTLDNSMAADRAASGLPDDPEKRARAEAMRLLTELPL